MKAPSPAFSLYPKDILSDEACSAMTDEELGVYVRLLCHAWLEGSIPADATRLARMTRRSLPRFERVWLAVGPCWDEDPEDPSRLVQRRMERERTKQVTYSELQRQRAQRHAGTEAVSYARSTKRPSRGSAGREPNASRTRAGSSLPSPSPSPSPDNELTDNGSSGPRAGVEVPTRAWSTEACDDWIARFGGTAPGGQIGKAIKPLVDRHGWQTVRERWRSYLSQAEPQYASASRFAATFGDWVNGRHPPKSPKGVIENNRAVLEDFVKGGRS